jgi:predicted metal-dependent enzyme (double-stranded beta helix superfamily)
MPLSLVTPLKRSTTTSRTASHSPAELRRIAREFAADPALAALVPADNHDRTWLRLDTAPDVAAWLIRWPAGTSTGWHDHIGPNGLGVGGVFVVLAGELTESTWSRRGVVRRALGAGGVRSFGPNHVHDVGSTGPVAAVSVHVYSPLLEAMRSYSVDSGRLEFIGVGPLDEW